MEIKLFERVERTFKNKIVFAKLTDKADNIITLQPFEIQPIEVDYDIEGIEHIKKKGNVLSAVRFTPTDTGKYTLEIMLDNEQTVTESFDVVSGDNKGYIKVSAKDSKYFEYSNGESFYPIGVNMVFPTKYPVTNGTEFGTSGKYCYIGLRQYRSWFEKFASNGVNMVRLWLGHEYFSPDTEDAEKFDLAQFSKIDMIVQMAKQYGLKLKLTIDQFRFFKYDSDEGTNIFSLFNKQLYLNGKRCESADEWITEQKWRNAWLNKVNELAKRYAGDTEIFAIELWNEMNCFEMEKMISWNNDVLPKVKAMFPSNLVTNSLGSLDCEGAHRVYNEFCWDRCDFKQLHRYLDQGARYADTGINPIEAVKSGLSYVKDDTKPLILAETGAVNNRHCAESKFYSSDDMGLILVDCVYTPVFLGFAGCGNIWHWDYRYIESKCLHKYFKPLADMVKDIDFVGEEFKPLDLSDEDMYMFALKGKTKTLVFARNKDASWQTVLRDLKTPKIISKKQLHISAKYIDVYNIWGEDTTEVLISGDKIELKNINYGIIFTIENK